jgi:redox-sensitive bicupin YhaK (pirin superfamily)
MISIRKSNERGHADHGWLNTYHTFSFGSYFDPAHMGFRSLRVMNEDRVAAGQGFGTHPHKDMEIVSYVLEGALEHQDSLGNGEVLRPGEFQRITAGTGIAHSEFNPLQDQPTHFYQIWLLPRRNGLAPSYKQKRFDDSELRNTLRMVASPEGENGSLTIHQDARIYLAKLDAKKTVEFDLSSGRHAWLQVLRGTVMLNGTMMDASDGAAVSNESKLAITAAANAEVLLFDLV